MRIRYSDEIRQPPERVFPWIAEPEKAMQWQKNVREGKILVEKPEKIGTTFTEILEEDGNTLEMRGTITEYVENKVIGFHIQSRIHEFDVSYSVEEIRRSTRLAIDVNIRWKFPMNVLSLFIGKKMKAGMIHQLHEEVLELKRICEAG